MAGVAERAERIAAHLVGDALGCDFVPHDVDGRQGAVDFRGLTTAGRHVALEVTLIGDPQALEWDGVLGRDAGWWPAEGKWNFRPDGFGESYKKSRAAAVRLASECDQHGVDDFDALEPRDPARWMRWWRDRQDLAGSLRRAPWEKRPGIRVYPPVRSEFVNPEGPDVGALVEGWLGLPHLQSHLDKVANDLEVDERHLFLAVTSDMLPARLFADDFETPLRVPAGFSGLDGLWVWSEYWHRYLACGPAGWRWMHFPGQG